jgi:hypothetical protein
MVDSGHSGITLRIFRSIATRYTYLHETTRHLYNGPDKANVNVLATPPDYAGHVSSTIPANTHTFDKWHH